MLERNIDDPWGCRLPRAPVAGNNAVNLDALASLGYSDSPCLGGMTLDGVICVGAATENGTLADYSNFGARAVALAAPGSVRSTWPGWRCRVVPVDCGPGLLFIVVGRYFVQRGASHQGTARG